MSLLRPLTRSLPNPLIRTKTPSTSLLVVLQQTGPSRYFTTTPTTMGKDPSIPNAPPKHQMAYFPALASSVRSFGQFRRVLQTGLYSQLVAMEIPVGGDIGNEVHLVDQVLLFTSGEGRAVVAGKEQNVSASDVIVVPAGTEHQFYNTSSSQPLELITIYSPAEHHPQTVHQTKEEGDEEEENEIDVSAEWSRVGKEENERKGLVKEEGGPYEDGDDGRHGRKVD